MRQLMAVLFCAVCMTGAVSPARAQSEYWKNRPPRVGDVAPPFRFPSVLSAGRGNPADPEAYSSARLQGRVIVLDFFATWCAPCIAAIPHMNTLMADTRDLPVNYLAVGKEPADLLRKTLAKHPMDTPFLHDATGSVSDAFWVTALPHVVVIDRHGRIHAVTHPTKLTRDVIISAASAGTATPQDQPAATAGGAQRPAASLSLHVTENRAGSIKQNARTGEFIGSGIGAPQLLRTAWGVGQSNLDLRVALPETAYDVHIIPPAGAPGAGLAMLRAALDGLFNVTSRIEARSVKGYRLIRANGAAPLASGSGQGRRINRASDRLEFADTTMEEIARTLSLVVGQPVQDATGLSGAFALELRWTGSGTDPVIKALEKAGFALASATVSVDFLVVEQRK